jgi:hypothetical protein
MSNLLSWSYWFSLSARELMPSVKIGLLVAFLALFAVGFLARMLSKKRSEDLFWAEGGKRVASMAFWMAPFGLFFLWCTHELTYFFGARFWFLIWIAAAALWTGSIVRHLVGVVPGKKSAFAEKARIQKWLPRH